MHLMRIFFGVIFFSSICCGSGVDQTEYLAVLINGKKVGYAVTKRIVKNSQVVTSEEMEITITRMGIEMSIRSIETYIETLDGRPIGFESSQDVSGMTSSIKGIVTDGKLNATIQAGGMNQKKTMDYPEGALMAEGLRLFQLKRGFKESDSFSVKMFVPSMLTAVDAKVVTGGKKTVDLFGRVVTLTEQIVTMKVQGQTMRMVSLVDENLQALKSTIPMMGKQLELIACDKKIAMSKNDIVDLIDSMLLNSPVPLGDVRKLSSAEYHLVSTDGRTLKIPQDKNQTVTHLGNGKTTVTVAPTGPASNIKFPYAGTDKKILAMLKSSPYIQSDHTLIESLAKKAVGDAKDAATAVARIEKFVGDYIDEKNLSVGYASALEVAQSRQGDCSEHAVLTAAMCRAAGIPARVATGLVYVEEFGKRKNIFGAHVWTEAYVGDKWVAIDATRAPNGFGPGHIKLATGSGEPADFLELTNTLGYFKIEKVITK